ncbi:hypothetical protein GCM10007079_09150 [Nocardiopsis terrae]|uniref:Uncharacterized protein n=1 Tax=Nocardiopsis terrae TaxID=372655 RepID=A0ABR9HCX3_9ACTN|nr:hypothetical protein [Nocardiopsis terrae]MBE1456869.1 hypothetical protein [Nocardiopsis terrae]GHC74698.1 hypothetical protein GCM10007079_09150 [Nocardiopsis terrae]
MDFEQNSEESGSEKLPLSLSATVMAHPSRSFGAERVLAELSLPGAEAVFDPRPDAPPGSLRTAAAALSRATPEKSTHHLLLQDDVLPAEDLPASVLECCRLHPDAALSFFVEWGSRTAVLARMAVFSGISAVPVINPYMPSLALAMPSALTTGIAERMGRGSDGGADDGEPDDRALLRLLRERGVRTLTMVPNLVEHDDLPSLTGNTGQGVRRSACFTAEPGVPFDASVLDLPRLLPFYAWNTGDAVVIDTAEDVPAAHRPTEEVLTGWGLGQDTSRRALAATSGAAALAGTVRPDLLLDAWNTAVALGAVQEHTDPGSVATLRDRAGLPLVRRALYTHVPGALRVFVDAVSLEPLEEELVELTLAALELGAGLDVPPGEL